MMREAAHGVYGNSHNHLNDFPKAETVVKPKHYLRKHFSTDEGSFMEPARGHRETTIRAMAQR